MHLANTISVASTVDAARAAFQEALTSHEPASVLAAGQAYFDAIDLASHPPVPPDMAGGASIADLEAFLDRLATAGERSAWRLAFAHAAFEAGDEPLTATLVAGLEGAPVGGNETAAGVVAWLEAHAWRLTPEQWLRLLPATELYQLPADLTAKAANRMAAGLTRAVILEPSRGLALLQTFADWAPSDESSHWRFWQPRVVATALGDAMRVLGDDVGTHVAAIHAVLNAVGAPWRSVACLPQTPALIAAGLVPVPGDLTEHPDEVLAAPGVADWLPTLGDEAPKTVFPTLRHEAFKAFDSRFDPLRRAFKQAERGAKAYRALLDHFPIEAMQCLDAITRAVEPQTRLLGRRLTRRPSPGWRVESRKRHLVVRVGHTGAGGDTQCRLVVAEAIAPERPEMAAGLMRRALAEWDKSLSAALTPGGEREDGLWMTISPFEKNPILDKLCNLMAAGEIAARLAPPWRETLEAEITRLIEQEELWLRSFHARGNAELARNGQLHRLAPAMVARVVSHRLQKDEELRWVGQAVEEALGGLTPAAVDALFRVTSELWDNENRLWSRQMMLIHVASSLLETDREAACRVATRFDRGVGDTSLHAFEVRLFLSLREAPDAERRYRFEHPLLDGPTEAPAKTTMGPLLARLIDEQREAKGLLERIADERDPYERAFAYAWAARRTDAVGDAALEAFERLLPDLVDDYSLAGLLVKIAALAGPRFGGREARVFGQLLRALDVPFMVEPEEAGPLVFRAVHRLPAETAEAVLMALVDDEALQRAFSGWAQGLMQAPTTLDAAAHERLLRRTAARLLPRLGDGGCPVIDRFISAYAPVAPAGALTLCQAIAEEDLRDGALFALLPHAPAACEAHAPLYGYPDETLSAGAIAELEVLATAGASPKGWLQAIADAPGAGTARAILTMALRHHPEMPDWLLDAHAGAGEWDAPLATERPWSLSVVEHFEATLLAKLKPEAGYARAWFRDHEGLGLLARYVHRDPKRAAATLVAWFPELDLGARWAAARAIETASLPRTDKLAHLSNLLAWSLKQGGPHLQDVVFAAYSMAERQAA